MSDAYLGMKYELVGIKIDSRGDDEKRPRERIVVLPDG
jgi:hypothetical protein